MPIQLLLTLGILVIAGLVLLVFVLVAIYLKPTDKHKFCWHQLVQDSFYISIIDGKGREHVADIHYNANVPEPSYSAEGERRLQIKLPVGFTRLQFFEFISTISDIDGTLIILINGIKQEKLLSDFHFTPEDLGVYRDFKRHLLLKALKG